MSTYSRYYRRIRAARDARDWDEVSRLRREYRLERDKELLVRLEERVAAMQKHISVEQERLA